MTTEGIVDAALRGGATPMPQPRIAYRRDASVRASGRAAHGSDTLGKGKPLFPRRVPSAGLGLVSVRQMGAGMVALRYAVRRGGTGPAARPPPPGKRPRMQQRSALGARAAPLAGHGYSSGGRGAVAPIDAPPVPWAGLARPARAPPCIGLGPAALPMRVAGRCARGLRLEDSARVLGPFGACRPEGSHRPPGPAQARGCSAPDIQRAALERGDG